MFINFFPYHTTKNLIKWQARNKAMRKDE